MGTAGGAVMCAAVGQSGAAAATCFGALAAATLGSAYLGVQVGRVEGEWTGSSRRGLETSRDVFNWGYFLLRSCIGRGLEGADRLAAKIPSASGLVRACVRLCASPHPPAIPFCLPMTRGSITGHSTVYS